MNESEPQKPKKTRGPYGPRKPLPPPLPVNVDLTLVGCKPDSFGCLGRYVDGAFTVFVLPSWGTKKLRYVATAQIADMTIDEPMPIQGQPIGPQVMATPQAPAARPSVLQGGLSALRVKQTAIGPVSEIAEVNDNGDLMVGTVLAGMMDGPP